MKQLTNFFDKTAKFIAPIFFIVTICFVSIPIKIEDAQFLFIRNFPMYPILNEFIIVNNLGFIVFIRGILGYGSLVLMLWSVIQTFREEETYFSLSFILLLFAIILTFAWKSPVVEPEHPSDSSFQEYIAMSLNIYNHYNPLYGICYGIPIGVLFILSIPLDIYNS